ncbi:MAG TPA: hypothetical protein VHW00_13175 [Thermoanaerobaculia bacterium]|nr:hypothetical protein [Thermoanaerobaculia bacterium]
MSEALSVQRLLRDVRVQFEVAEDEHLSEELLMAYADDALPADARDAARAHCDECDRCRADVEELRRLQFVMRRKRSPRWVPYAIAAAAAAILALVLLPLLYERSPAPLTPVKRAPSVKRVVVPPASTAPVVTGYGEKRWDEWVARAKETRTLAAASILAQLKPAKTTLRGTETADALELHPNGSVVLETRPRFHWNARESGTYNVILQDGDRIIESGLLTSASWVPPFDLRRGGEYGWQVEVTIGEERSIHPLAPAPPAKFVVLDDAAVKEIRDALQRHPNDALLHAVLYARYGLREETASALEALRGGEPELANALRKSLDAWP